MHKIKYAGNGATTEYVFDFKWFQAKDVRVAVDGAPLTESEYSVSAASSAPEYESDEQAAANDMGIEIFSGGKVIFKTAPADGAAIIISRRTSLDSLVSFNQTERVLPNDLNTAFAQIREFLSDLSIEELQGLADEIENIESAVSRLGNLSDVAKKSDIPDISPATESIANLAERLDAVEAADYVVDHSAPGANPWWRKYKSGWVEQGGKTEMASGSTPSWAVQLPVAMNAAASTGQATSITYSGGSGNWAHGLSIKLDSNAAATIKAYANTGISGTLSVQWEIKGPAA